MLNSLHTPTTRGPRKIMMVITTIIITFLIVIIIIIDNHAHTRDGIS